VAEAVSTPGRPASGKEHLLLLIGVEQSPGQRPDQGAAEAAREGRRERARRRARLAGWPPPLTAAGEGGERGDSGFRKRE
jgi:hypothetical protein